MAKQHEPTAAELYAAQFVGMAKVGFNGLLSGPTSFRLPVQLLLQIDALGRSSGLTRSTVMMNLLEAGLEAVQSHMTEEQKEELFKVSKSEVDAVLAKSTYVEEAA